MKPNADKKTPDITKQTILQMFDACMARENRLLSSIHKNNLLALYKRILFDQLLFWPDPIGGFPLFEETFSPSRDPYVFSVAQTEDDRASVSEWRYLKLLELLRDEKNMELRWLLLARWLKQENISEPENFLPKPIMARLVRHFFASKRLSPTNLSYWAIVTGWKPYFILMQSALQKVRNGQEDPQSALEELGFDPPAINRAITKGNMISAIMHWIAERRHIPIATLRNSYAKRK